MKYIFATLNSESTSNGTDYSGEVDTNVCEDDGGVTPLVGQEFGKGKCGELCVSGALGVSVDVVALSGARTKPMKAHATMTETLFFAVPPPMNPMKRRTFPPMMNHRRPKRSEFAPQILDMLERVHH